MVAAAWLNDCCTRRLPHSRSRGFNPRLRQASLCQEAAQATQHWDKTSDVVNLLIKTRLNTVTLATIDWYSGLSISNCVWLFKYVFCCRCFQVLNCFLYFNICRKVSWNMEACVHNCFYKLLKWFIVKKKQQTIHLASTHSVPFLFCEKALQQLTGGCRHDLCAKGFKGHLPAFSFVPCAGKPCFLANAWLLHTCPAIPSQAWGLSSNLSQPRGI